MRARAHVQCIVSRNCQCCYVVRTPPCREQRWAVAKWLHSKFNALQPGISEPPNTEDWTPPGACDAERAEENLVQCMTRHSQDLACVSTDGNYCRCLHPSQGSDSKGLLQCVGRACSKTLAKSLSCDGADQRSDEDGTQPLSSTFHHFTRPATCNATTIKYTYAVGRPWVQLWQLYIHACVCVCVCVCVCACALVCVVEAVYKCTFVCLSLCVSTPLAVRKIDRAYHSCIAARVQSTSLCRRYHEYASILRHVLVATKTSIRRVFCVHDTQAVRRR